MHSKGGKSTLKPQLVSRPQESLDGRPRNRGPGQGQSEAMQWDTQHPVAALQCARASSGYANKWPQSSGSTQHKLILFQLWGSESAGLRAFWRPWGGTSLLGPSRSQGHAPSEDSRPLPPSKPECRVLQPPLPVPSSPHALLTLNLPPPSC